LIAVLDRLIPPLYRIGGVIVIVFALSAVDLGVPPTPAPV
jgi:hypothetical protein